MGDPAELAAAYAEVLGLLRRPWWHRTPLPRPYELQGLPLQVTVSQAALRRLLKLVSG